MSNYSFFFVIINIKTKPIYVIMAEIKSKYFKLSEFEASDTAKAKKIDNSIPVKYVPNVQELVTTILDPLRIAWGSGIHINSGYRSPALNKAVGGSQTSAHSYALAADLKPTNGKIAEFKKFAIGWLKNHSEIKWDQVIDEYSGAASWLHIGLKNGSGQQRRQWLLYKNGKYSVLKP